MADFTKYASDILSFAQEQFLYPGDRGPQLIHLEPHQKRLLTHLFTPGAAGRFPYETILLGEPKKSGKTALAALVSLWVALRGHREEVILAANDLDQAAGRVFAAVLYAVQHNPALSRGAIITARKITLSNESTLEAIPSDFAGAAGGAPSLSCFDELWAVSTERARRLWDELTPPPTRKNPLRLVVSYAGFTNGESELLYELYQRGLKGEPIRELEPMPCYQAGRFFMLWDTVGRMPWQTAEYYAQQKADLRPSAYLRLHQNQWVTGAESFIDSSLYDKCVIPGARPVLAEKSMAVVAGVDLGVKSDQSAVVVCTWDSGSKSVRVVKHKAWRPLLGQVNIDDVADYIRQLAVDFDLRAVRIDPWQAYSMIGTLQREGIRIVEYTQSPDHLGKMANTMIELFKSQGLILYDAQDIKKAVQNAALIETPRGYKLAKDHQTGKIDLLVALAMGAVGVLEQLGEMGQVQVMPGLYAYTPEQIKCALDGSWDMNPDSWEITLDGQSGYPNGRKVYAGKHADTELHRRHARKYGCEICYREYLQVEKEAKMNQ